MQPHVRQGLTVSQRFDTFLNNIRLTTGQIEAGAERREKVVETLNSHYWGSNSKTANSLYVGSWGKRTRVRPPRDVDVLFKLPYETYERFSKRTGNIQSQLLQEVKRVLGEKFRTTAIKGDGPVVAVPFTAYNVELIPAFSLNDGRYYICMTDGGGYYKTADYSAEEELIRRSVNNTNGNIRPLIRMMKRWQANCQIPLKSFWIELLAVDFLDSYTYRDKSSVYYDWMVRDFLKYLEGKKNGVVYAPGTYEPMFLGDAWGYRATVARKNAEEACENEGSYPALAGGLLAENIRHGHSSDMTQRRVNEIVNECRRQEESCQYTAAGLYLWQKNARFWKNVFIVVPIVAGGLATSQIVTNAEAQWTVYVAAVLALFAGLFPAIFEALGMDMRVREIGTSASEFTNLRDRFRILAGIGADMDFDELNPSFEQLMDRMDAARTIAPPLPEKYFEYGRKKIEGGDYSFEVDAKSG